MVVWVCMGSVVCERGVVWCGVVWRGIVVVVTVYVVYEVVCLGRSVMVSLMLPGRGVVLAVGVVCCVKYGA